MIKLKFAYKKISKLCIHAFESCQCVCVFNKYMILQDTLLIPTSSHCAIHCSPSLHPSPAGAALPQPVPLLHRQHLPAEPHAGDPVLRHALLRPQRLQCWSRWLFGHWSFRGPSRSKTKFVSYDRIFVIFDMLYKHRK